ncbi:VOC family protein [Rhizobium sp. IBUN]|uniref:VOC family protein n=1 Tax=Rhizobium sp. IBUN TaxID=1042326 RepID=UPI000404C220|nr:VOC family protein [Rhizobium sp. IBUN]
MSEKRRVVAVIPCNNLAASEDFYGLLGCRRDPDSEDYGDYVILTDDGGAEIHLTKAAENWLVPGKSPFGI